VKVKYLNHHLKISGYLLEADVTIYQIFNVFNFFPFWGKIT